ncbi:MAG: hypothetical protein HQL63_02025 [Magnetococcales bacterium]|nr:hypothetical protein [Magnetococcales bacterium]MBF0322558.1 hypothetical protein [Magnetococcales bacterium]
MTCRVFFSLALAVALFPLAVRAAGDNSPSPPAPNVPAQQALPSPGNGQGDAPKEAQKKNSPEETQADLARAQQHFLEGLHALGEAGRRTFDEHVPQVQDTARKTIEEAKKMMQQWEDRLHNIEQGLSPPKKAVPQNTPPVHTDAI